MFPSLMRRLVESPTIYDFLQRLVGHRDLQRRLAPHLDAVPAGGRVVDIGGGTGLLQTAVPDGRYVCVDLDADKLRRFRLQPGSARAVQGDATACPLVSACAAAVVCTKVTHHLDDRALAVAFAEMARLVAPGGVLIVADAVASPRLLPRALWRIDRGSHVRSADAILAALPPFWDIVQRERFRLGAFHDFVLIVTRRRPRPHSPPARTAA